MSVSSKGNVAISVNPGNTATGSDELTLTTNCSSGYVVYASATSSSASTSLSNGSSEISASSNTLASPGALSDNTWGIANASNYAEGKFAGLPTYANYNVTALTSGDSSASSSKIPVYYGVKVSSDITPGTYTGDVLYTAMVNSSCYAYTVHFNANGGTGEMDDQDFLLSESKALSTNTFTRSGYTFRGWNTVATGGVKYTDGETVSSLKSNNGDEITLYAVWADNSLGTLQDFNESSNLLNVSDKATLIDTRDYNTYTVKRLADGHVWLAQNLRYENTALYIFSDTSYGALYNWANAQTACPSGWHLPAGGSDGEYVALDKTYGGTGTERTDADMVALYMSSSNSYPGFVLSGGVEYRTMLLYRQGTRAYYWTSTEYGTDIADIFDFHYDTSAVLPYYPYQDAYKVNGFAVRCVADYETVSYMQDFSCSTDLEAGKTTILTDSRDNQKYSVYKFPSSGVPTGWGGMCLMQSDLNLGMVDGPNASGSDTTISKISKTGGLVVRNSDSNFYSDDSSVNTTLNNKTEWAINYVAGSGNGSGWSTTNSETNKQYTYGYTGGATGYTDHAYYSWGAALVVCPKGWRLPTYTEYNNVATTLGNSQAGSNAIQADPYYFQYGGSFFSGFGDQGASGYYWSALSRSSDSGRYLRFFWSSLSADNGSKNGGFSVRCVAK